MKHFYKIIFGLAILFLDAGLSSCSIAVKAVYNQFSDKDEFVLFPRDRNLETGKTPEQEKDWDADLVAKSVADSL